MKIQWQNSMGSVSVIGRVLVHWGEFLLWLIRDGLTEFVGVTQVCFLFLRSFTVEVVDP